MRLFVTGILAAFLALPSLGQQVGSLFTPARVQQTLTIFQQRELESVREQLQCTEDEFGAIEPYVRKVIQARTVIQISMGSAYRTVGPGINAALNGAGLPSELQQAIAELQAALDDKNSTPQTIQVKLQSLRDSRQLALANLKAAQETLRAVLTQRQEGSLVDLGLLD
jgi:hypothetical protein